MKAKPDLHTDLRDLYDAVAGLGVELEALVTIARAVVKERYGHDPLEGTVYAADDDSSARLQSPPWVND
jgi:hypothetical protein